MSNIELALKLNDIGMELLNLSQELAITARSERKQAEPVENVENPGELFEIIKENMKLL